MVHTCFLHVTCLFYSQSPYYNQFTITTGLQYANNNNIFGEILKYSHFNDSYDPWFSEGVSYYEQSITN